MFKRIFLCVTDRNFSKTVVNEPFGTAMKYFLIFMVLVGVITMTVFSYDFNESLKEITQTIQQKTPDFRLENGTFICRGEMPIVKASDGTAVIIDTTGKTNENVLDEYNEGFFITSSRIVCKQQSQSVYQTINFKDIRWLNFTKQGIIRFINTWTIPIVFIFGLIFIGIGKFINILLVSLIGLIMNAFMKSELLFENIMKLSIYSITLSTVITMIVNSFDIDIPYFFVVYYIIVIFYLYRYLAEIKKGLTLSADKTETLPENIQ